jgi:hypothetical protein
MKKTLLSLATVGLLLSAGAAFSQNTDTKSQSPGGSATTRTQSGTTGQTNTQTQSGQSGERSGSQSGERRERSGTQSGGERREGQRGERREGGVRSGGDGNVTVRGGDRQGARVRERGERSSVNVRIRGDRDGYRYRRHHRGIGVYVGGCRTIIVKSWHHGHRVIKRIRRCG